MTNPTSFNGSASEGAELLEHSMSNELESVQLDPLKNEADKNISKASPTIFSNLSNSSELQRQLSDHSIKRETCIPELKKALKENAEISKSESKSAELNPNGKEEKPRLSKRIGISRGNSKDLKYNDKIEPVSRSNSGSLDGRVKPKKSFSIRLLTKESSKGSIHPVQEPLIRNNSNASINRNNTPVTNDNSPKPVTTPHTNDNVIDKYFLRKNVSGRFEIEIIKNDAQDNTKTLLLPVQTNDSPSLSTSQKLSRSLRSKKSKRRIPLDIAKANVEVKHQVNTNYNMDQPITEKMMVEERLKIENDLCRIFDCLLLKDPMFGFKLAIDNNECLYCLSPERAEEKKVIATSEAEVLTYIYNTMTNSILSDNYLFFNSQGISLTLMDIEKLIPTRYPAMDNASQRLSRNTIHNVLRYYHTHQAMLENYLPRAPKSNSFRKFDQGDVEIIKVSNDTGNLSLKLAEEDLIGLDEEEIYFRATLQRIYPVEDADLKQEFPIVKPEMFFLNLKRHKINMALADRLTNPGQDKSKEKRIGPKDKIMATLQAKQREAEQMVKHTTYLVNLPKERMPYHQKNIILNFYKEWLRGYLLFQKYFKTWKENKDVTIDMILQYEMPSRSLEIQIDNDSDFHLHQLCEEIEVLVNEEKCNLAKDEVNTIPTWEFFNRYTTCSRDGKKSGLNKVRNKINSKIGRTPKINQQLEEYEVIQAIAAHMKVHAASTFHCLTNETMTLETACPHETGIYSNRLANFVYTHFVKLALNFPGKKAKEEQLRSFYVSYFNLYLQFLRLAMESRNIDDFESTFAVCMALNSLQISKVFDMVFDKNMTEDDVQRKYMDLKVYHEIHEKHVILNELLSLDKNFVHLKQKMNQCHRNKEFFVPCSAALKHTNTMLLENYDRADNLILEKQAFFMLESMANEFAKSNAIFNDLRSYLKCVVASNYRTNTDIIEQIYESKIDISLYAKEFNTIAGRDK